MEDITKELNSATEYLRAMKKSGHHKGDCDNILMHLANIEDLVNKLFIANVSGSFFLVQERKPEKDGEYDVVTKRGRLIKANFIKGDKIGLDRWACKSEDHRLNEGVMAWGNPLNYR